MKRLLPLLLVLVLGACAGAAPDSDATSQAQASTALGPLNGAVAMPSTGFCHPIRFWGASAHAGARTMQWGVPASGGWSLEDGANFYAFPENTSLGVFAANVECHQWSEFTHQTSGAGVDAPKSLNWNQTTNLTWVSGQQSMSGWTGISPCWLDGVAHMSATGEHAWMALAAGGWVLNAEGYAALFAAGRCAWLGRPIQPIQVMTASPGAPAYASFGPASGTCFLLDVSGNVDDGVAGFTKQTPWKLEASGGVVSVKGYCTPY